MQQWFAEIKRTAYKQQSWVAVKSISWGDNVEFWIMWWNVSCLQPVNKMRCRDKFIERMKWCARWAENWKVLFKPYVVNRAWLPWRASQIDKGKVHIRIIMPQEIVIDDQNCNAVVGLRFGPVLDVISCPKINWAKRENNNKCQP